MKIDENSNITSSRVIDGQLRFIALDKFKFILMIFVCMFSFGKFSGYLSYFSIIIRFAVTCFFFISGYFVLTDNDSRSERIKRTIKHSAITFGIMAAAYFIINVIYYTFFLKQNIFSVLTLRTIFNFVFLNEWPFEIGSIIWYVQAILYAYIAIYILDKLNWLKYDWFFALILLAISFATGEFAGIIGINFHGYTSLSPNFFNFAMPVLLLGCFFHRKKKKFKAISVFIYIAIAIVGVIFCLIEWTLIVGQNAIAQYDLLVGHLIIAIALCKIALDYRNNKHFDTAFAEQCDFINRIIYFTCPLIGFIALTVASKFSFYTYIKPFIGIAVFVICFIISDIALAVKYRNLPDEPFDDEEENEE